MTGPELGALATRLNVNPYYLGYALVTGAASCKEAFERDRLDWGSCAGYPFVAWNEQLWREQAKIEGVGREWVATADGAAERHTALIASKIADHQKLAA